jgi:hypothetical protein
MSSICSSKATHFCRIRKLRRGLASPDLGDCLAMTFSLDIPCRLKPPSQLVYHWPGQGDNAWMGG